MLVFIDESYQIQAQDDVWIALSAVCLPRESSRDVARELFNLKKRFWKVRSPDEVELKGSKLLSRRGILSPRNRDFVQEVTSLCKLYSMTPFAVAQNHPEGLELSRLRETGRLPDLHKAVLRRVNRLLQDRYPDRLAILSFDERTRQDNRRISRAFRNFLFKSAEGQDFGQVVETPFFHDSQITPAAEIADIVAYIMGARYAGRNKDNDPAMEALFNDFRNITYNPQADNWSSSRMWGFSALGIARE